MKNELVAPNSIFSFTVQTDAEVRLDKYLSMQFPMYSRSFIQGMIQKGVVLVNDMVIKKAGTMLKSDDQISIQFNSQTQKDSLSKTDPQLSINIIAEKEHFLVINKPANLMVHAPHLESEEFTLVDWILKRYKDIASVGVVDRPGIVHRLDKDTSGVIIIPKTNFAHTQLSKMFADRSISKTYLAIVEGHPEKSGIIDAPIGRCKYTKIKRAIYPETIGPVRASTTHYNVIEYFEDHSLLEIKPLTGRTHQIRVHLASIGHPILSDKVYGKESKLINRQALHAHSLSFELNNSPYDFTALLPEDFEKALQILRQKKC